MTLVPWRVLARAEVTKTLAHGERYLETRVFLGDGRILEQIDPGVPDIENGWREIGRSTDLGGTLRRLRREGWEVVAPAEGSLRIRSIHIAATIVLLGIVFALVPFAQRLGAQR